jgi:hypothetical protein
MNVFAGPNLTPLFKLTNHLVNQTARCNFATEGVGVNTGMNHRLFVRYCNSFQTVILKRNTPQLAARGCAAAVSLEGYSME